MLDSDEGGGQVRMVSHKAANFDLKEKQHTHTMCG